MSDVTRILSEIEQGDRAASDQLLPVVYDELRKLAAAKLKHEKPGQTLQATALVHEAYIRLVDVEKAQHWDSRGHFFVAAAEAMRRVLIDNARKRLRQKRGGQARRVQLNCDLVGTSDHDCRELIAVHELLDQLAIEDPLPAELVKLRYFAGLTVEHAAQALGISTRSAYRNWTYARAWLFRKIENADWRGP